METEPNRTGFTPEEYIKMSISERVKRTVYVTVSGYDNDDKPVANSFGPELPPDEDYEP